MSRVWAKSLSLFIKWVKFKFYVWFNKSERFNLYQTRASSRSISHQVWAICELTQAWWGWKTERWLLSLYWPPRCYHCGTVGNEVWPWSSLEPDQLLKVVEWDRCKEALALISSPTHPRSHLVDALILEIHALMQRD